MDPKEKEYLKGKLDELKTKYAAAESVDAKYAAIRDVLNTVQQEPYSKYIGGPGSFIVKLEQEIKKKTDPAERKSAVEILYKYLGSALATAAEGGRRRKTKKGKKRRLTRRR